MLSDYDIIKRVPGHVQMKYFRGLKSLKEVDQRYKRIQRGKKSKTNDPKAYRPFKTDKNKKVRESKYTKAFFNKFPDAKSLKEKAKVTGVPFTIIKNVYDRGLAAWRTGHRPGASQHAWGYARVHSFLMKGCTYYTADSDLVEKSMTKMSPMQKRRWTLRKKMCDNTKR